MSTHAFNRLKSGYIKFYWWTPCKNSICHYLPQLSWVGTRLQSHIGRICQEISLSLKRGGVAIVSLIINDHAPLYFCKSLGRNVTPCSISFPWKVVKLTSFGYSPPLSRFLITLFSSIMFSGMFRFSETLLYGVTLNYEPFESLGWFALLTANPVMGNILAHIMMTSSLWVQVGSPSAPSKEHSDRESSLPAHTTFVRRIGTSPSSRNAKSLSLKSDPERTARLKVLLSEPEQYITSWGMVQLSACYPHQSNGCCIATDSSPHAVSTHFQATHRVTWKPCQSYGVWFTAGLLCCLKIAILP